MPFINKRVSNVYACLS